MNRPHQKRGVVQHGMIQTLKTSGNDVGVVVKEPSIMFDLDNRMIGNLPNHLRIRKLTPLECFRLMGFDDEDFYKIKGISNTQLYKMAGNSIVVDVLKHLFIELLKINILKGIKL